VNNDISTINYSYLVGAKDFSVPVYRHNERFFPFVSLTYMSEGEFYCECNGKTYVATRGEIMYVPESLLHNVYTCSRGIASWGHISATSYKYSLMKNSRKPIIIKGESAGIIKDCLDELALIKYDSVYSLYKRDNCISRIFCELFKYTEASENKPKSDWCVKLQGYIAENVREKFNLDDMAKMMFISKSCLCHRFKKETGVSLIDYILGEKIKASFYLLADGMNNRQIAEKLSLSDEYYFSKLFKKTVGISPKEYKQIYIQK
jgi:AraC-like DNA-binding protein